MKNRRSAVVLFVAVLGIVCLAPAPTMAQGRPGHWEGGVFMPDPTCITNCGPVLGQGGDSDDRAERRNARQEEKRREAEARLKAKNREAVAAYGRGDYREALRLFYEQQKLRDGPKVRQDIATTKKAIADTAAYDAKCLKVDAALKQKDYKEALKLLYEQQKLRDGPNVQKTIKQAKQIVDRIEAYEKNYLGIDAEREGDYELATKYYKEALRLHPAEPIFLENYNAAEAERVRRWNQKNSDPMVVNGQNVPSGLPKSVEDAIVDVYQNAPPGVSGWVRKGFQAVMVKDWNVAKACLGSALLLDPENSGLKRMIALTEYTNLNPEYKPPHKDSAPVAKNSSPDKTEIDQFFRDFRAGQKSAPSEQVRRYVLSLSDREFWKLLLDLEPQDSDMEYLFDLSNPRSP